MQEDRALRVLEFTKIRDRLAAFALTEPGKELCLALKPYAAMEDVDRAQRETEEACTLLTYLGGHPLSPYPDVRESLTLAQKGASLSPRALLDVASCLRAARSARAALVRDREDTPLLRGMASRLISVEGLERDIASAILSEEEIADRASAELHQIRRQIRSANERMRDRLNQMIRSPSFAKYLQDSIITMRDDRYCVPVKAECRQYVPGLVHDQSATGATLFVEPMFVVELGNDLRQLHAREEQEIARILKALSERLAPHADDITQNIELLTRLDFAFAKGMLARDMRACMPRMNERGSIRIVRGRHPLIDPAKVVPCDLWLGDAFTTLIITGPNTGGKTVTLKTIGLLTLMAMCGLMPPADDGSSLSVFSAVLADIGDEQSIEQSLSTFSAHMTNIIRILDDADGGSLVLLDELGAGTDPVEGAALAIAILERLREKGARIAATTHYAELKAYAIQSEGVENGSCEFDVATLRPTYRLLVGVPGRSNAFAISERLGMDPSVVQNARDRLSGDDRRLEDVVTELEDRRRALEDELKTAREATRAAEQAKIRVESDLDELDRLREKELQQAREEARRLLERARNEAEALIRELDDLRRQKNAADFTARAQEAKSRLRSRLNAAENAVDPVSNRRREEPYAPPRPLRQGDTVLLTDLDKEATVLAPPDSSGNVEVQAGIIRTRVPLAALRLIEGRKVSGPTPPKGRAATSSGSGRATRSVQTELDLRGQTADEALLEVDRFIDGAVMAGLGQITIIHGKGTGALRAAVHAHLRTHPSVKSYRLGTFGEGETGVTIVEI